MIITNIEKDIEKLKDLGILQGEVVDVELTLSISDHLRLKQFLNKYSHIKEEDIISSMLYEFMQKYK